MEATELRPCDWCGGAIAPIFYVVRSSIAVFKENETNQFLGLTQMLGGSVKLAAAMGPADVVTVGKDEHAELETTAFVCHACALSKEFNLLILMEHAYKNKLKQEESNAG